MCENYVKIYDIIIGEVKEMGLRNRIKGLSSKSIESMNEAVESHDKNRELFHKGEFDVYNMINMMLQLGKSKREIAKLSHSLELESKARHAEAEREIELEYEDGRLNAIAAVNKLLKEGI